MIRQLSLSCAALVAVAGLSGCGTTQRRADASDPGLVKTSHIGGHEIEEAVRDMAKKISEKNARGWEAHIPMSSDNPPKPQVRVDKIQNRTRVHFDVVNLRNELLNTLVEQEVVYLVGSRDGPGSDSDAVMDERAYAASGMVDADQAAQAPEMGGEDMTGLLLRGEITDDVIEVDGVKQHDYWFSLRLVDTRKGRVVLTTRTKMRKVRD